MDNYEPIATIGEGTYGVVLKARHKPTGMLVAIKKFKESDDDDQVKKTALREIRILKQLKHENIVSLIEVFRRKGKLYLVFEYVERTILEDLEKHPNGLDAQTVKTTFFQLLRALQFIHSHNIVHRDIKPENLLISKSGVLKLCDFGFARSLSRPGAKYTEYVATRWYRAPELLVGDTEYGKGVDVWAAGCMFAEITNGQPLFPGESDLDQLHHIIRCFGKLTARHMEMFAKNPLYVGVKAPVPNPKQSDPLIKRFADWDANALSVIKKCLRYEPDQRDTCAALLAHPYFAGVAEQLAAEQKAAAAADPAGAAAAAALLAASGGAGLSVVTGGTGGGTGSDTVSPTNREAKGQAKEESTTPSAAAAGGSTAASTPNSTTAAAAAAASSSTAAGAAAAHARAPTKADIKTPVLAPAVTVAVATTGGGGGGAGANGHRDSLPPLMGSKPAAAAAAAAASTPVKGAPAHVHTASADDITTGHSGGDDFLASPTAGGGTARADQSQEIPIDIETNASPMPAAGAGAGAGAGSVPVTPSALHLPHPPGARQTSNASGANTTPARNRNGSDEKSVAPPSTGAGGAASLASPQLGSQLASPMFDSALSVSASISPAATPAKANAQAGSSTSKAGGSKAHAADDDKENHPPRVQAGGSSSQAAAAAAAAGAPMSPSGTVHVPGALLTTLPPVFNGASPPVSPRTLNAGGGGGAHRSPSKPEKHPQSHFQYDSPTGKPNANANANGKTDGGSAAQELWPAGGAATGRDRAASNNSQAGAAVDVLPDRDTANATPTLGRRKLAAAGTGAAAAAAAGAAGRILPVPPSGKPDKPVSGAVDGSLAGAASSSSAASAAAAAAAAAVAAAARSITPRPRINVALPVLADAHSGAGGGGTGGGAVVVGERHSHIRTSHNNPSLLAQPQRGELTLGGVSGGLSGGIDELDTDDGVGGFAPHNPAGASAGGRESYREATNPSRGGGARRDSELSLQTTSATPGVSGGGGGGGGGKRGSLYPELVPKHKMFGTGGGSGAGGSSNAGVSGGGTGIAPGGGVGLGSNSGSTGGTSSSGVNNAMSGSGPDGKGLSRNSIISPQVPELVESPHTPADWNGGGGGGGAGGSKPSPYSSYFKAPTPSGGRDSKIGKPDGRSGRGGAGAGDGVSGKGPASKFGMAMAMHGGKPSPHANPPYPGLLTPLGSSPGGAGGAGPLAGGGVSLVSGSATPVPGASSSSGADRGGAGPLSVPRAVSQMQNRPGSPLSGGGGASPVPTFGGRIKQLGGPNNSFGSKEYPPAGTNFPKAYGASGAGAAGGSGAKAAKVYGNHKPLQSLPANKRRYG